jgi:D-serine deaminase-like pyridoxal phosphate-dependent protein
MAAESNDMRLFSIAKEVRHVLACVRTADNARPLDGFDDVCLDRAADALAVILVLDAGMNRAGALSPSGATMYADACRERDAMLAALKIENPYRLPKNKLA